MTGRTCWHCGSCCISWVDAKGGDDGGEQTQGLDGVRWGWVVFSLVWGALGLWGDTHALVGPAWPVTFLVAHWEEAILAAIGEPAVLEMFGHWGIEV